MKLRNIYYILLGVLALSAVACQEDANDWGIEPGHDRLFRTTELKVVDNTSPTTILLSYRGVTDASRYIFEFSKGDSLEFTNIVKTVEILADTLTPYRLETTAVKTEYRTFFTELDGTSRYSVRVKAVDEKTGKESGYVGLFFETPDEQIFTTAIPSTSGAVLKWKAEMAATHIRHAELKYTAEGEGEEQIVTVDTVWVEPAHELTASEKQAGAYAIEGLNSGTNYLAYILNGDVRRGKYRFTTLGSSVGSTIEVQSGDDINALLASAPAGPVTLAFKGGESYTYGEIAVPKNVGALYLAGNVIDGQLPHLTATKMTFEAPIGTVKFQNIDLISDGKSQFFIEIGNANCFKSIAFEGCYISEIPRSLVRLNNGDVDINGITISNCIVKNVALSGYGLFNFGKAKSLKKLVIENSTLCEIGDQLMDVRLVIDEIIMDNCIFCNYTTGMPKVFRLDKQPKSIAVTSTVFTGTNAGSKINSGNSDYSGYLDFSGCYLTSDFQVNSIPFTNAKSLSMTSLELFVDPMNGDFHYKPELKFEGEGKAGDPRWWIQ